MCPRERDQHVQRSEAERSLGLSGVSAESRNLHERFQCAVRKGTAMRDEGGCMYVFLKDQRAREGSPSVKDHVVKS